MGSREPVAARSGDAAGGAHLKVRGFKVFPELIEAEHPPPRRIDLDPLRRFRENQAELGEPLGELSERPERGDAPGEPEEELSSAAEEKARRLPPL